MAETNPLLADFVAAYDGLHPLLEAWLQHAPFCIPDPWGFLEGLKKSQKQLEIVVGTFFWPNAPFLDFLFFFFVIF